MGALSAASDRLHLWSPVLVKELRTRMRGARPLWLQAGYVFAMLVVLGATYAAEVGTTGTMGSPLGFRLGHALYLGLFIVQAVLVALIMPGLTAGAISGEQEQRTYEMLASTRLRSRQVVLGKLLSAWLFAVLLLTTSLPLAALCLLFGGVSPAEVMWSYGLIALCALLLAAIGLWWSSAVPRSLLAVMGAYATMGVFMIASGLMTIDPFAFSTSYSPMPSIFAGVNPIGAIYYAANPVPVYGWVIPAGVAGAVVLFLSAALVAASASQRLPLFGPRAGVFVRGLMLLLFAVVAGLVWGSYGQALRGAPAAAGVRMAISLSASALMTGVIALAAVIASGEVREPRRGSFLAWLAGGLSPRRLLQPQVRSAFGFMIVLALVGFSIVLGGLTYFLPSLGGADRHLLYRMAGLTLATVFGSTLLGAGVALEMPGIRGRVALGAGLVVTYLLALLVVAAAPPGPPLLSLKLAYLNPALIALSYVNLPVYGALRGRRGGIMGLGAAETSAAIFVLLGLIGLFGARRAFRRAAAAEEGRRD